MLINSILEQNEIDGRENSSDFLKYNLLATTGKKNLNDNPAL